MHSLVQKLLTFISFSENSIIPFANWMADGVVH